MTLRIRLAMIVLAALLASAAQAQNPPATSSGLRMLTVDDYVRIKDVEDAQISPEGKWVAYTVETHKLKEDKNEKRIWMISTSGGEAIPLTAEGVSSSHPRWSPDGKYVAFLSGRGEGKEEDEKKKQVWVLNRQGGEAQQLTVTIQDVDHFEWSPSGDRLVLVLQDPSPEELEAAKDKDKDGEGEKSKDTAKPKPRPWVIDRLHFKEDEIGYLDRRRKHLFVFTLADHKMTQITSGDYDDSEPAWSPDGRSIAFTSNRTEEPDRNFNSNIWTVAADNTDKGHTPVRVTSGRGTDGSPTWSPDGKWIAFTTQLDPRLFQYATFHLAVAPATGGEAKVLTKGLDRNASAPRFSADGRWIYFIVDDDGTQNLLRVLAAGGEISRPIGGRRMVESFSMNKDGVVAAVITDATRPPEAYLLRPSGDLRRLTTTNDALMSQLRLADGEYVHFRAKTARRSRAISTSRRTTSPARATRRSCGHTAGPCGLTTRSSISTCSSSPQTATLSWRRTRAVLRDTARISARRSSRIGGTRTIRTTWRWWITLSRKAWPIPINSASAGGLTARFRRTSLSRRLLASRPPFPEPANSSSSRIMGTIFTQRMGIRTRLAVGKPRAVGKALALQFDRKNHHANAYHGRRKRLERSRYQRRADVSKSEAPWCSHIARRLPRRVSMISRGHRSFETVTCATSIGMATTSKARALPHRLQSLGE